MKTISNLLPGKTFLGHASFPILLSLGKTGDASLGGNRKRANFFSLFPFRLFLEPILPAWMLRPAGGLTGGAAAWLRSELTDPDGNTFDHFGQILARAPSTVIECQCSHSFKIERTSQELQVHNSNSGNFGTMARILAVLLIVFFVAAASEGERLNCTNFLFPSGLTWEKVRDEGISVLSTTPDPHAGKASATIQVDVAKLVSDRWGDYLVRAKKERFELCLKQPYQWVELKTEYWSGKEYNATRTHRRDAKLKGRLVLSSGKVTLSSFI